MKLRTRRDVDALSCPEGKRDKMVFDDELPGFGIRLTSTGSKIWLLQYHDSGKVRRLQLGPYPEVLPAEARRQAEIARGQVRAGGSPVADREAAVAARQAAEAERAQRARDDALTFGALIDQWQAGRLKDRRESYAREAVRLLRVNLPNLATVPARAIDARMAARALDELTRRQGQNVAAKTHRQARAMFGWALKRQLGLTINPFADIELEGTSKPRARALTRDELGAAWRAARAMDWPFGPFLCVLMMTLQRRGEVAGMRWSELSPDFSYWSLPAARTKNGRNHEVFLTAPVRDILRALPHLDGSDLVFTTNARTPISGFSHAARQVREAAGAEITRDTQTPGQKAADPWRLHDFRRTGVTAMQEMGVALVVSERLLNHVSGEISGLKAVYHVHPYQAEMRDALERWAAYVLAAAKGK